MLHMFIYGFSATEDIYFSEIPQYVYRQINVPDDPIFIVRIVSIMFIFTITGKLISFPVQNIHFDICVQCVGHVFSWYI